MRSRFLWLAPLVLATTAGAFVACNDNGNGTVPPIIPPHFGGGDAASDATVGDDGGVVVPPGEDGGSDACVQTSSSSPDGGITVGPATLAFDPCGSGSPDALFWDANRQTLYVADDHDGTLWTWTDATGFQKIARLPASDAGATTIGGITGVGNLIVLSRNGGGESGALFQYDVAAATGLATPIGGTIDATRYRTGVAYDAIGTRFFSASYASAADAGDASALSGSIDLVGLTATTPFVTGLSEPRAVLVSGTQFVVSDRGHGAVIAFPLAAADLADAGAEDAGDGGDGGDGGDAAAPMLYATLATLPGVDQLSAGPAGSILAASHPADGGAPQIQKIAADGGIAPFQPAATFTQLGGVAYDAQYNRVFVADSNGGSVRTIKIYPAQ